MSDLELWGTHRKPRGLAAASLAAQAAAARITATSAKEAAEPLLGSVQAYELDELHEAAERFARAATVVAKRLEGGR